MNDIFNVSLAKFLYNVIFAIFSFVNTDYLHSTNKHENDIQISAMSKCMTMDSFNVLLNIHQISVNV